MGSVGEMGSSLWGDGREEKEDGMRKSQRDTGGGALLLLGLSGKC